MESNRRWLSTALVGCALGIFGCQEDNEANAQIKGEPGTGTPASAENYHAFTKKQQANGGSMAAMAKAQGKGIPELKKEEENKAEEKKP